MQEGDVEKVMELVREAKNVVAVILMQDDTFACLNIGTTSALQNMMIVDSLQEMAKDIEHMTRRAIIEEGGDPKELDEVKKTIAEARRKNIVE